MAVVVLVLMMIGGGDALMSLLAVLLASGANRGWIRRVGRAGRCRTAVRKLSRNLASRFARSVSDGSAILVPLSNVVARLNLAHAIES